jgi:hypothetical protein
MTYQRAVNNSDQLRPGQCLTAAPGLRSGVDAAHRIAHRLHARGQHCWTASGRTRLEGSEGTGALLFDSAQGGMGMLSRVPDDRGSNDGAPHPSTHLIYSVLRRCSFGSTQL